MEYRAIHGANVEGKRSVVRETLFFSTGCDDLARPGGELEFGEQSERAMRRAFVFGRERDYQQDFLFGIRQLADIAVSLDADEPVKT